MNDYIHYFVSAGCKDNKYAAYKTLFNNIVLMLNSSEDYLK